MSASALIGRGIGFGGVHYVPTLGLKPGAAPPPAAADLILPCCYDPTLALTACYDPTIPLRAQTMPAVQGNIALPPDNKTIEFEIFQADLVTPQNASGWTFTLQVHDKAGNVFFSRTGADFDVSQAASGVVTCALTPADAASAGLVAGTSYYYRFWRSDSGHVDTLRFGRFTFQFV